MSNGIEIKNLPSATTIKQNDTMTIVQDRENKQLTLDRFANESDLTTLTPLEARCDEVKAKIEVDEYSAEITTSQSMSKIGSDDSGANLHENVLDGAFESCVLKGHTKCRDIDTGEILDTFQDGRNLSLIDVKSPILTNVGKNLFDKTKIIFNKLIDWNTGIISDNSSTNTTDFIKVIPNTQYTMSFNFTTSAWTRCVGFTEPKQGKFATDVNKKSDKCYFDSGSKTITFTTSPTTKYLIFSFGKDVEESFQIEQGSTATTYEPFKSNILSFNQKDDKTIVLRSLPDGTCDTLNVETSEYVQRIGERSYQNGDINSNTLVTDGTKTQYKLSSPIMAKVDVQGFPHAYKNGHIQLTSGSIELSLTPIVTYKVPVSRMGQIASNTKSNLRQSIKLDQLEILVYQSLINTEYENLLVQNSAESAASFRNLSVNGPKDELYYMLKHLIEENQPVQNMLDKINLFYLYGLLSDEHYFDLLLGGEEDVY